MRTYLAVDQSLLVMALLSWKDFLKLISSYVHIKGKILIMKTIVSLFNVISIFNCGINFFVWICN